MTEIIQTEFWTIKNITNENSYRKIKPIVNIHELDRDLVLNRFKSKYFSSKDDGWLDFIIKCRNKEECFYDYVEGAIADDKIYNFVNSFLKGEITRKDETAFKFKTHQIMIRNDAILCLRFIIAYDVEDYERN